MPGKHESLADNKRYRCRIISRGVAQGEALVTRDPLGFNFGVDGKTGIVTEKNHELEGQAIVGKVLIFPHGKGSTGGSLVLYQLSKNGVGPRAIINQEAEGIIAVGAILGGIPAVDRLESNSYATIHTGDLVVVNANEGFVEIMKAGKAVGAS